MPARCAMPPACETPSSPTPGDRPRPSPSCWASPTRTGSPQAEIWMGAHPKAPSSVETDGGWEPLDRLIERHPEDILGRRSAAAFEGGPPVPVQSAGRGRAAVHPGPPGCRAGGRGLRARKPPRVAAGRAGAQLPGSPSQTRVPVRADPVLGHVRLPQARRKSSNCCDGSARWRCSPRSPRSPQTPDPGGLRRLFAGPAVPGRAAAA